MSPRRRVAVLALLLAGVLALGGCVDLPRTGSVASRSVTDRADDENLFDYTPAGPQKGTAPVPLVENFLTAMTATPLNTLVARSFLTSSARRTWAPDRGTVVYGGEQLVQRSRGRVTLVLQDVVELDDRGSWLGDPTGGRGHDYRIRVVKEAGQWRISRLPDRLLIPRTHFDTQYDQHLLYFLDRTSELLVPEPVFVPRGRQAPTFLMTELVKGPSPGLGRVERTALPAGTTLDGISVPVTRNGIAEVPLSSQVLDVDDRRLEQIFAQVAWTLGRLPGIDRVQITVDGAPIDRPGRGSTVGIRSLLRYDPTLAFASTQLFGIRSGRVTTVDGSDESRISGPLGAREVGIRSFAVDMQAQHVAAVSTDGRRVLEADRDGVPQHAARRGDVHTLVDGAEDLADPAYDLLGQLWLVDRTAAGATLRVVNDKTVTTLSAPGVTGARVVRFLLSRDGTRLITQVRRGGRDVLRQGRVQRDTDGRVLRVGVSRRLPVPGSPRRVLDIGWRTPSSLLVLTRPAPDTSQLDVVRVDGSRDTGGGADEVEPFAGRAVSLVSAPTPGTPVFLGVAGGRLFELRQQGWVQTAVRPGLRAPTFVG